MVALLVRLLMLGNTAQAASPKAHNGNKTGEASTRTVKTCDGGATELKANEKRVLDLHNEVREKHGLVKLCIDPTLEKAARTHSKEMIDKDYFSHNSYSGESSGDCLTRFGYRWWASGENIASGAGSQSKPEDRLEAWMKSPGHKKNILDKNFRKVGVGSARGNFEGYEQTLYTVDFGTRH